MAAALVVIAVAVGSFDPLATYWLTVAIPKTISARTPYTISTPRVQFLQTRRSSGVIAVGFWEWLTDSAAEFGYLIADEGD